VALEWGVAKGRLLDHEGAMTEYLCAKRALENDLLRSPSDLDPERARLYRNLGIAYERLGELEDAIESYRKSRHFYQEPSVRQDIAETQWRASVNELLGDCLKKKGNWSEALEAIWEAVDDYTGLGSSAGGRFLLSRVSLHIDAAGILKGNSLLRDASIEYKKAVTLLKDDSLTGLSGTSLVLFTCLDSLGQILEEQQRHEEALRTLSEAVDLSKTGELQADETISANLFSIEFRRGYLFKRTLDYTGSLNSFCRPPTN
jgi:tetratricopeptide (TPR) repeat protein